MLVEMLNAPGIPIDLKGRNTYERALRNTDASEAAKNFLSKIFVD